MSSLLEASDHEVRIKSYLKELMTKEAYWNVIIFCSDGALAHNKLIIGLIFPGNALLILNDITNNLFSLVDSDQYSSLIGGF